MKKIIHKKLRDVIIYPCTTVNGGLPKFDAEAWMITHILQETTDVSTCQCLNFG